MRWINRTLYNRITLLIELTPNYQCYHEVYKVNGKVTQERIVSGSGNWSNHKPIMIRGDTGNYKEMKIKSSGNDIETKELGTIQEYEIYDSSGSKVY